MRTSFLLSIFVLASSLSIPAAPAQDSTSARTFLEAVYRHYGHGGKGIDLTGPKADRFFDPTLIALARRDEKAARPDIGALDGDVLCSCQDWEGVWDLKIAIQRQGENRIDAAVSFALREPNGRTTQDFRALEITLAANQGQWRIYDVLDKSDPKAPFALRAELQKDIGTHTRKATPQSPR
ncbi:MAG TPA: DUF3828 domain-containing protein [Terracidiphilus sp.]|jgi:hypothetical protein